VVVPGGFGLRGIEGKIAVAKHCRENKKPYLGLCLGSQIMAIEFARNILGIKNATSEEFHAHSKNKIIHFLPGQSESVKKGGTLRLGAWPCVIKKGTKAMRHIKRQMFPNGIGIGTSLILGTKNNSKKPVLSSPG
jgi:CTP synthase